MLVELHFNPMFSRTVTLVYSFLDLPIPNVDSPSRSSHFLARLLRTLSSRLLRLSSLSVDLMPPKAVRVNPDDEVPPGFFL